MFVVMYEMFEYVIESAFQTVAARTEDFPHLPLQIALEVMFVKKRKLKTYSSFLLTRPFDEQSRLFIVSHLQT